MRKTTGVGFFAGEKSVRTFSPKRILKSLDRIVLFFTKYHLDYLLIGGFTLGIWGRPRTTLDLDFLLLVKESDLEQLKRWLRSEKLQIDRRWSRCNPLLAKRQIRLQIEALAVDLLIPVDKHDLETFRRKKRKKFGRRTYNFVSPEDLVLQKLKVGRPRDFEDALSVLKRSAAKLKVEYLYKWARRLRLTRELRYLLDL